MLSAGRNPGAPRVLRDGKRAIVRRRRAARSTLPLARLLPIVVMFFFSARVVRAQAGTVNPQGGKAPVLQTMAPGFAHPANAPAAPVDYSRLIREEACDSWTAAAVDSPTVSVARLAVPGKARSEFQKACGKLKDDLFSAAEDHARRAVKIYPDYAAAWVVLGQALTGEDQNNEAAQACQQAMRVDPTYAPPYICLAQFAERTDQWNDVFTFSDHARSLDPAHDPYAYYYAAVADLHLQRYAQAELDGRFAERLDAANEIPGIHLLLAEVYRAKRDTAGEAAELQKFLDRAPHDSEWQTARTTLAQIQGSATK